LQDTTAQEPPQVIVISHWSGRHYAFKNFLSPKIAPCKSE